MIEKTPCRRLKAPELRKVSVNTSMTLEQREMFLTLGGSAWLQKEMDLHLHSKHSQEQDNWQFNPETRGWSLK